MSLRPLPDLNDNYTPARPWVCVTRQSHHCTGPVVGAIGAIPVCANGAVPEEQAVEADRARRTALLAHPAFQSVLAQEAAMERAIEAR